MEKDTPANEAKVTKRDEWEIKEDLHCVKRALKVFKDKERLEDVKNLIKEKKADEVSLEAILDGDMKKAIGID